MFDNFPFMADRILQQFKAGFQNQHFIGTFSDCILLMTGLTISLRWQIKYYSNSELFFKIHISLIPLRLYMTDDWFHNFPLMADKILQQFKAVSQNPYFIDISYFYIFIDIS